MDKHKIHNGTSIILRHEARIDSIIDDEVYKILQRCHMIIKMIRRKKRKRRSLNESTLKGSLFHLVRKIDP